MSNQTKVDETKEAVEAVQQETSEVESQASVETTSAEETPTQSPEVLPEPEDDEETPDVEGSDASISEDETLDDEGVNITKEEIQKTEAVEEKADKAKVSSSKAPQYKPEKEGAVTKFFKFEFDQARSFDLDKGFVKVVPYKRLRVKFIVVNDDYDFDYDLLAKKVESMSKKAISGLRVEDIDIRTIPKRNGVYYSQQHYSIVDIMVPYMRACGKVVSAYKIMLQHLNADSTGIKFKLKIESVVDVLVNTNKERDDANSFKGFAAFSFSDGYVKKVENEDVAVPAKVYLKSAAFIDEDVKFPPKDVMNMNDVLLKTKVRIYKLGDTEDKAKHNFVLPFRTKFSVVTYQLIDMTDKNKFKIARTLNRVRMRNVHAANVVIPIGVYVTQRRDTVTLSRFEKFFVDTENKERKNACALETYVDFEQESLEMKQFKNDCNFIDRVILDEFVHASVPEEEKPAEVETPDASPAPVAVTIPEAVTIPAEEAPKPKKTSKRKKKAEEAPAETEEPKVVSAEEPSAE